MVDNVVLRKAVDADIEITYAWRNAEEVRQNSFNKNVLDKAIHEQWFSDSLKNSKRHLLIAEQDGEPVGVLRFDVVHDIVEVNIYLNPRMFGRGIGTKILELGSVWVKQNIHAVKKIEARVLADNAASQRAFEKSGYVLDFLSYQKIL